MFPTSKNEFLEQYLNGAFETKYISSWSTYGIQREDVSLEDWPSENYFANKVKGASRINGECVKRVRVLSETAIKSKGAQRFTLRAFTSNCAALIGSWYGHEEIDLVQIRRHADSGDPEILAIVEAFWLGFLDGVCAQLGKEGEWGDILLPHLKKCVKAAVSSLSRFGAEAGTIDALRAHLTVIEKNSGTYYLDEISSELFPDLESKIETRQYTSHGSDYPSILAFLLDGENPKRRRHAMLVGEGGIGKTVSVQTAARKALSQGYLAVLIPLNVFTWRSVEGGSCIADYIRDIVFRGSEEQWDTYRSLCDNEAAESPVFLFLDGWNEISSASNNASMFIQGELENEWMNCRNLTIVITGREQADRSSFWSRELEFIEALPLKKDNISRYLEERGALIPSGSSNMWETLANPLMITLYTNTLEQKNHIGNLRGLPFISDEPNASTQSAIIWNFIQCQIAKFSQSAQLSPLDVSTALVYAAATAGATMKAEGRFELKKSEVLEALRSLPAGTTDSWLESEYCISRPHSAPSSPAWNYHAYAYVLCDQTKILHEVELENGEVSYAFMHQKFRDFFNAVYMRAFLKPYSTNASPSSVQQWKARAEETETLNMLAPLFTRRELDDAWRNCSASYAIIGNDHDFTAFHLIELYRRLNVTSGELDYTEKDLRDVHFYTYGNDLQGCNFERARIGDATFLSEASNEHVDLITFAGSSGTRPIFATASEGAVFIWDSLTGSIMGYRKLSEEEGSIQGLLPLGEPDRVGVVTTNRFFDLDFEGRTESLFEAEGIVSVIRIPSSERQLVIRESRIDIVYADKEERSGSSHAVLESGKSFGKHRLFFVGSCEATELYSLTSDSLYRWTVDWEAGSVSEAWRHAFAHTVGAARIDFARQCAVCVLNTSDAVIRYDFETKTEEELFTIGDHPFGVSFSPSGRYLAAGLEDEIRIFDSFNGRIVDSFDQELLDDASAALVQAFAFSEDETYLLCSHATDAVSIWDLTQANYLGFKKPLKVLFGSDAELLSHTESLGGKLLLMTSEGLAYWFNPRAGRIDDCGDFGLEGCRIEGFAISPDSSRLFVTTNDLDLYLYAVNGETFEPLGSIECTYSPDQIRFSTDSGLIFVSTERDDILVFDANDLKPLYEGDLSELLPGGVRSESICPIQNSQILVSDLGNTVHTVKYRVEGSHLEFTELVASNEIGHECMSIDASIPNNRIVCMGPFDTITAFDKRFDLDEAHNLVDDDQRVFDAVEDLNLEVTYSAMSPSSRYYAFTLDTEQPGGTFAIVIADLNDFSCKMVEFEADKAHTSTVDSLCFAHGDAHLFIRYGEDGLGTIDVETGKIAYSRILPSIRVFKANFTNASFEEPLTPSVLEANGAIIDKNPNILEDWW